MNPSHGLASASPPVPWRAYAALASSMALVGTYVGLSPLLVAAIPVMLLAWLRFGVASVAMAGWLRPTSSTDTALSRRAHALLFLQSLLGNFLFTLCALYGTSLTGALSAGVMMAAIPAAVAVLSRVFLHERLNARVWSAVLLSACAVVLLALARSPHAGDTVPSDEKALLGHILLVIAVLCEASYVVIGKGLSAHVSPRRQAAIINLWGLALSTPLGVMAALQFDFGSVPMPIWSLFLFYSLAASVVTVWLWLQGLQHVPAQQAGVFSVLLPLFSAATGVIVLQEPWNSLHVLALLLAVSAVLRITRGPAPTT